MKMVRFWASIASGCSSHPPKWIPAQATNSAHQLTKNLLYALCAVASKVSSVRPHGTLHPLSLASGVRMTAGSGGSRGRLVAASDPKYCGGAETPKAAPTSTRR